MPAAPVKAVTPATPLPKQLIETLPAATEIVHHLSAIRRLQPALERQLATVRKKGPIPMARAFCVFHRLMAVLDEQLKPLRSLFEQYKVLEVPKILEDSGVTSVPLDVGYRVTVSYTTRASIKADHKEKAYDYLRQHYPDVVIETVNASTLSSLARELHEEQNIDLPEDLFTVALVPNTSVTKTG